MASETLVLECRHCKTQNRLDKLKALKNIESAVCGQCKGKLFHTDEEPFYNLSSENYEHPLDRSALNALRNIPGVQSVIKFLIGQTYERYNRIWNIQNHIKVTPTHVSYIYDMLKHSCDILDIKEIPDTYIMQTPIANACVYGVDHPNIVLTSEIIDLLNEEELLAVISHELAHIHAGHLVYKTAAYIIIDVLLRVGGSVLANLGTLPIMLIIQALLYWDRCSELTADRAEVLVTKNFDASVNLAMKLSSGSQKIMSYLDRDEFFKQADEAKNMKEVNIFDHIIFTMQAAETTHPFPIWRVGHLKEWVENGEYIDILQGKYMRNNTQEQSKEEDPFDNSNEEEPGIVDSLRKIFGI